MHVDAGGDALPVLGVAETGLVLGFFEAHFNRPAVGVALDDLASHMDVDQFALASMTEDHREGVGAFRELVTLERRRVDQVAGDVVMVVIVIVGMVMAVMMIMMTAVMAAADVNDSAAGKSFRGTDRILDFFAHHRRARAS